MRDSSVFKTFQNNLRSLKQLVLQYGFQFSRSQSLLCNWNDKHDVTVFRLGKLLPSLNTLSVFTLSLLLFSLFLAAPGRTHDNVSAGASDTGVATLSHDAQKQSARGLGPVLAQNTNNATDKTPSFAKSSSGLAFSWGSYMQGIGMFFILLAMLWILVWLLKRYGFNKLKGLAGRSNQLEILETLSFGPKRTAVLLRAKDRTFLIGVTDTKINLLSELYDEAEDDVFKDNSSPKAE